MELVTPYQEDAALKDFQDERRAGTGAIAVRLAWVLVSFQQWYEGPSLKAQTSTDLVMEP